MADMLAVKPVEGRTMPVEGSGAGAARRVVDTARMVPNTAYYRVALRQGDLAEASDADMKAAERAANKLETAAPKGDDK